MMLKKIAIGLVVVIALLIGVIAFQPATFEIERSTLIAAPADVVYPHIASLRAMDQWSPFATMDPQMKTHYEGPESGVGARSVWEGPQMGAGSVTVVAVEPDRRVEMRLAMVEPMATDNRIVFTLAPQADGTKVTWHMDGANSFAGKAMSLIMSMDKMVGAPFEQGLAGLKTLAEADAQKSVAR